MNCTPKNFWGAFMTRKKLFYLRHSIEEKLSLIRRYDSGATVKMLSEESGIYYTQIKELIRQYCANGSEGLSMKNTRYPASLKAEIVSKILNKGLSLH
jgi:transposase-like protein